MGVMIGLGPHPTPESLNGVGFTEALGVLRVGVSSW